MSLFNFRDWEDSELVQSLAGPFSLFLTFAVFVVPSWSKVIFQASYPLHRPWTQIPCPSFPESWFSSPLSCPLQNLQIFPEPMTVKNWEGWFHTTCKLLHGCLLSPCSQGPGLGLVSWVSGTQSWSTESVDSVNVQASSPMMGCNDLCFFLIAEITCLLYKIQTWKVNIPCGTLLPKVICC